MNLIAKLVCGVFAVAAAGVHAADALETTPKEHSAAATVDAAGMMLYRDPISGRLMKTAPTDESATHAARPVAAPQIDMSRITHETRADGTQIDHLNGVGEQTMTMHRDANGKIEVQCTDAFDAAQSVPAGESSHDR